MKKTFFITLLAVLGLLAVNTANASATPTCDAGKHYEANIVEKDSCHDELVCTRLWHFPFVKCEKETKCVKISVDEGSCVADPVVEEPAPVIETPAAVQGVSHPPIVQGMSYNRIDDFTTDTYLKFPGIYGKMGFLTTLKGKACISVSQDNELLGKACDTAPAIYHLISVSHIIDNVSGSIEFTPSMFDWRGDEFKGKSFTIIK